MISERLKNVRDSLGLSQQAMAEKLGVSLRSQQNYESGSRSPDAAYLTALAGAGVDITWLLTGSGSHPTAAPALKPDEAALLDNYRHSPPDQQRLLKETSAAFAQCGKSEKSA